MRISRQFADVAACSPVLRGTLSARAGFENATVDLFGIEPAFHLQTTNLAQQLIAGSFDDFRNNPNSVIIGSRLADALEVGAGRRASNCFRRAENIAASPSPRSRAAASASSMPPAFILTCGSRRRLLRKPFPASMIVYKLRDPDRAPALAQRFRNAFPTRIAKLAGPRGSQPSAFPHPADFRRDHGLVDHSAGRLRHL